MQADKPHGRPHDGSFAAGTAEDACHQQHDLNHQGHGDQHVKQSGGPKIARCGSDRHVPQRRTENQLHISQRRRGHGQPPQRVSLDNLTRRGGSIASGPT